ncbi:MAG: transposase [Chloroflexus sp.]|uniref:transposase n=1 Tax=Chloroflexus sp. TaxID=1904827 RepID=UPI003D0EF39A
MADGAGRPLSVSITRARPHEVTLVETTLEASCASDLPRRLLGDCADDRDRLDRRLAEQGIEMIAPHRRNRRRPKTPDGRNLRRSTRRWKIERLFAWLGYFRRPVLRYERHGENFLGFVQLGCMIILLRHLL